MSLFTVGTAENIVAALLAVLSLTLFVISVFAYVRSRNIRMGLIAAAFLLFFCQGVLFGLQLFYQIMSSGMFYAMTGLISVVILLFIFAATFKR